MTLTSAATAAPTPTDYEESPSPARSGPAVLEQLRGVCADRGLDGLADRLAGLGAFVAADLATIHADLDALPERSGSVGKSGLHLLSLGGKRLRPLCVALAARLGTGFDERARHLAVAAEYVHSATLLHDDVVDLGDVRRGKPTARVVYGNAASVFAGDWLLVEALRRVRQARLDDVLDRLLEVIDVMIAAETLQLDRRGRLEADPEAYFEVVDGKTASLFRWAMFAGGRAGGLDAAACAALERYGRSLGLAFQVVDDTLDFEADPEVSGKALFSDLREGKLTHPLIVAMEREPGVRALISEAIALPEGQAVPAALGREVRAALARTGAVDASRALSRSLAGDAREALLTLPESPARRSLAAIAEAAVHRDR
jgi:octaprenyl-diphosphate synthase